jgi:hypothetical protein
MKVRDWVCLPSVILSLLVLWSGPPAAAETVTVEAGRDATLIEHPAGSFANGSGPAFFVGHTAQAENGIRRALLYFDVASALPDGAIFESVSLALVMSPSNPVASDVSLHRLLADWGEGPSAGSGGGGAPSQPGDATWLHTWWDTDYWVRPGGQFVARSSAEKEVAGPGHYTWVTTVHLLQDVRLWAAAPERNFGWILIGDEGALQTSKNFASREHPDPSLRPVLEISYRMPGEPPSH